MCVGDRLADKHELLFCLSLPATQPREVLEEASDGAKRVNEMLQLKSVHVELTCLVDLMKTTVTTTEGRT